MLPLTVVIPDAYTECVTCSIMGGAFSVEKELVIVRRENHTVQSSTQSKDGPLLSTKKPLGLFAAGRGCGWAGKNWVNLDYLLAA